MNSGWSNKRGHRVGGWLVLASLVLLLTGCERDDDQPPGEESSEEREGAVDVVAEPGSAYDELDLEPIEPADAGPEAPGLYILSGLKGYTEPCGCTVDVLLGGIDRIVAFVEDAKKLHPSAYLIDAGDWVFEDRELPEHLEPQERAKAEVLAAAHKQMGTLFSVPGDRDLALGAEFYLSMMDAAGMAPLAANIELDGQRFEAAKRVDFGDQSVLFVGAGDPETYEGLDGVVAHDPVEAVRREVDGADEEVVILVYQGDFSAAEAMASAVDGLDFIVVGHNPRRQTDAAPVGSAQIVEAYDQGRYVGRLKFYGAQAQSGFVDARLGIREQRDSLDEQIRQVRSQLRTLQLRAGGGEEPPLAETLRERIEDLEERRDALVRDGIEIDDQSPTFLYDLIAMEPGYRVDSTMAERRLQFNKSLAELNSKIEHELIPVADGEPFFVGTQECSTCHADAHDFWENTAHASAVATLEERHKQFDYNCIGCHVVGWEQPGGSVMGQISYDAELNGRTFTKDLSEVGCESCHGAGSQHVVAPLNEQAEPQHIIRHPTEQQCSQCHVPDHSPNFDFDVFVEEITGEGHEYRSR